MRTRYYLSCAVILLSPTAFAQSIDRDIAKEALIWQKLQSISPRSVETFKEATAALDKGDHEKAARLYEAVFKKAPDFDPVLRRLGFSLVATGRRQEGMALIERAVKMNRSPENLISLARSLTLDGERSSRQDLERALTLAKEAARANTGDDEGYWFVVAQLSLDLERQEDLREATRMLVKLSPDTLAAHYCSAVVAIQDGDWIKAEDEIKKAQSLGLPAEIANEILAAGVHTRATVWRYTYYSLYLIAAWAFGLVLLFVLGKVFSKTTLQWIESADPNTEVGGNDLPIRKYYRWLMNVAGVYYYISIPVVAFLVLATAASITYAFFTAGRIPIKLVLVLVFGAVVTLYAMIRSLFIKIESEDPGRSLRETKRLSFGL